MRNIVLAQSVQKILQYAGNKVKIVNINNDRGIHICKSMLAYKKFGNNKTPQTEKIKSDHFVGDFYVKFALAEKEDPSLQKEAQELLLKWESGDKRTMTIWKKMNTWALNGFNKTYKKFNLKIDKQYYESTLYKNGREIIQNQFKKGIVKRKDDGALYIDLSEKGLGEKILLRADGTSIYITQDIFLALERKKEFNFDRMLYVVANEQEHHFKALFEILKRFGYSWADKLEHLSYGLVLLESGRMKSREGTVVDADDLISELESLARKELDRRYPDLSAKEKVDRASKIAMSALRYHFLKIDRGKDTLFKPEESISFEGNTGPYLLYTYARAKSILRRAKYKKSSFKIPELSHEEKRLVVLLSKFPEELKKAYDALAPNIIANYAYQISQNFNEYYHKNKIIGSDKEEFCLVLVDAFSQVLKNSLNLLGIEVLEQM